MERDSFLYKARRQCQVIAHKIMPDETMCKFYSRILLKKKVDLKNPQTFNEKIQWLKLHDYPNNPLVIQGADKYRFVEFDINESGKIELDTYKYVSVNTIYETLANIYLKDKKEIVLNSILTDSQINQLLN